MFRILVGYFFIISLSFSADVAIVKKSSGEVFAKRTGDMIALKVGDKLQKKDILITKASSSVGLTFHDGTMLSLGEFSILSIDEYLFNPKKEEFLFDIKLDKGLATFESGKIGNIAPQQVKFHVPEGTIGIRGTKFYVEVR